MKKINLIFGFLIGITFLSCSNDDKETLDCRTPLNITLTDITPNSVLVNWTEDSNQINVEIEYGVSGFAIGSGLIINTNGNGNSLLLENLNPETNYDIYLKTICNNQESEISSVMNFTTLCDNVYHGNLILSTQEEIDNFPSCITKIDGSLQIGVLRDSSDITSLAPLANITTIGATLRISFNNNLLSLFGLHNITSVYANPIPVGGTSDMGLVIIRNRLLTNIDNLGHLTDLGINSITIGGNHSLVSLNGLDTLFQNNSDSRLTLRVSHNNALTDLSFQSLTSLGLCIITNNDSLQSLESFSNIINGSIVQLTDNDKLSDFCGLQNMLGNDGYDPNYAEIRNNLFNPTAQDIIDGNCSKSAQDIIDGNCSQ